MGKITLDYNVAEPERVDGGRFDLDENLLRHLLDNCTIDRKYNQYLKDKSVIIVGPAAYMLEKESSEFIESFDIVVRLNRGWKIKDEHKKYLGERTDIRYHCGMEHENNGGAWEIQSMIDNNVSWASIGFPRYLSYFHNDILKFEKMNQHFNMNFHIFSDLELYLSLHHYMGTRMALGTTAFSDLILYDIKRLHISGITFLDGGYFKDYKQSNEFNGPEATYLESDIWKNHTDVGGHAMIPQRKLLKLLSEIDDRITMDKEVEKVINNA
tara:strand:- start:126 stop:932 length:807 start_codon:yes stop_codon:yes gene_type:complete